MRISDWSSDVCSSDLQEVSAMQTQAILKFVRLSPKKARAIADLVRGKPVDEARNILKYSTRKPARILFKVLESAIANAEHNHGDRKSDVKGQSVSVRVDLGVRRHIKKKKISQV